MDLMVKSPFGPRGRDINHLMLRKYGIPPLSDLYVTLHDFLDYLAKCGHINVKSVEIDDFDNHGAGYI